jgi:hypothetical protein
MAQATPTWPPTGAVRTSGSAPRIRITSVPRSTITPNGSAGRENRSSATARSAQRSVRLALKSATASVGVGSANGTAARTRRTKEAEARVSRLLGRRGEACIRPAGGAGSASIVSRHVVVTWVYAWTVARVLRGRSWRGRAVPQAESWYGWSPRAGLAQGSRDPSGSADGGGRWLGDAGGRLPASLWRRSYYGSMSGAGQAAPASLVQYSWIW